ncbi:MAG TPA: pyruvate:ferredoxin (flavodoxin) oxidoreductase, partial [Vicinamibacteria bacterium]|nr:pyruvate:ferredoxin (flavodoxin) oxidoreductase [Vicinamibacteria bacterium]
LVDAELVRAHRGRALTPDRPVVRGTAQNPDVYFQGRETVNPYYQAAPGIVARAMERFAALTGRRYRLFDYFGHPEAERVIVLMGSGAEAAQEVADCLAGRGEKVGVLKVRLLHPFSTADFIAALPRTVRALAVLDRTKEPGAVGDPLYLEILAALREAEEGGLSAFARPPLVVGGRYGLSSKEFDPPMVKAVFDELARPRPRNHFTVGIVDDVTHLSLETDASFDTEDDPQRVRAVFYGLGSDGTVGANKNSIKIIGEDTALEVQGYFVYDSKKSGATTVSHLRFGPRPIRSTYLVRSAQFVACHQFEFLEKTDVLERAAAGGTFLLNAPYGPDEVWEHLPLEVQQQIQEKRLRFFTIDAVTVAREAGMGGRINTVMQACFFALSGVLPREEAIARIKQAIEKTYGKRGGEVIARNYAAVDGSLAHLHEVKVPGRAGGSPRPPVVSPAAPDFVRRVSAVMMAGKGDLLPVSAFPADGTWPMSTTQWEKRNLAQDIPAWDPAICIQCNQCVLMCPHAAIRAKVYDKEALAIAPATFKAVPFRSNDMPGLHYTLQVAPEDCTGCTLCVQVCPAKDKTNPRHKAIDMVPQRPLREAERDNYGFFLALPEMDRSTPKRFDIKTSQLLQPLFEYSGACAGCGETPYVKLLTQLFGDRALIANATGCSSIYGGNLPTTPYCTDKAGRGPAWANSLFEDNAEFGLGLRLAVDSQRGEAERLLHEMAGEIGRQLVFDIAQAAQDTEGRIAEQRQRVRELKKRLAALPGPAARRLETVADALVQKSVW